jgi:hypothetical protein
MTCLWFQFNGILVPVQKKAVAESIGPWHSLQWTVKISFNKKKLFGLFGCVDVLEQHKQSISSSSAVACHCCMYTCIGASQHLNGVTMKDLVLIRDRLGLNTN